LIVLGAFLSRSNSIEEHYAVEKQVPPPIHGSIFKEFEPSVYPKLMRVRYDREDGEVPLEQFWVIDPSAFTTVERVLHEGRERYGDLGTMESVSVYLVDFGLFKWARGNDLLDLSSLNELGLSTSVVAFGDDGIMEASECTVTRGSVWTLELILPDVAEQVSFSFGFGHSAELRLFLERSCVGHTRLDVSLSNGPRGVNANAGEDMMKGSEYEILIVSRDADGIFVVSATLVGGDVPNKSSNTRKDFIII
uniref:Uncharacterized protein n=1 Tax=Parascaris equorum TaxID=6256 RepID=A0A914R8B1_PAREQ